MKFVASDGKLFDDFHACEAYENSLIKHDCKCESCSCDKVSDNSQLNKYGFVLYANDGTVIPMSEIQNPNRKKIKYVTISTTRTSYIALKNTFAYCGINSTGIDDVGTYVYCHDAWYNVDDSYTYADEFECVKKVYEEDKEFYTDLLNCIKKWNTFNS